MKIKKLKNGKYAVRLRIKVDGEWKEKRLTDTSETNLMYKASKLLKQAEHDSSSLKEWKFKEFYELFMKTFKEGKSSQSTINLYDLAYNQFVDYFGEKRKLNSIDAVEYQQFINHLAVDYAISTVDTRHRKIRAIFNKAVHFRLHEEKSSYRCSYKRTGCGENKSTIYRNGQGSFIIRRAC
ncbi:phage integrase SAM-like domain-containing protein [Listeria monocytogenes]|uniref:phage integrase SAM-like domain-containing protein n=1 Tax=Listeria monocytogenes TaxID=1639 RepID=UPI001E534B47|nr:phage integrase SAM-like domain-containing protein [Listeria monocytogenes]